MKQWMKFFRGENGRTDVELLRERPIPLELPPVDGWKEIPLRESGEPLVALGAFSERYDDIFTDSIYFGERQDSPYTKDHLEGSLITQFVREGAAKKIVEAQKRLPEGMHFVVFDTYRTLEVQQALFDTYYQGLKEQNPSWSEEELLKETQKYVSLPSRDATRPSPHNTGGSVDLAIFELPPQIHTRLEKMQSELNRVAGEQDWQKAYALEMDRMALIREHAKLLNFGTPFDYGGSEAASNHFEELAQQRQLSSGEEEARKNRRLLYNVMIDAGFEPYADEWWHYNAKESQMGAKTAGLPYATYGTATFSDENQEHETIRQMHRLGTIRLLQPSGKLGEGTQQADEYYRVAREAALATGDPRETSLPQAEVIKPPEK